MKTFIFAILASFGLSLSLPVTAANQTLKIDLISDNRGMDLFALRSVRKLLGTAVIDGVADVVTITPLKIKSATDKSGIFSACVEAGTGGLSSTQSFDSLIKRVNFVHPKRGTALRVEESLGGCQPQKSLDVAPIACGGVTGKLCPDNLICIDDPRDSCDPLTGGKDCEGICNSK